MADNSAKQDIQVTVGKDLSTATIQGVKVEVSPDSNVVVYTNDGVQTKPAGGEAAAKGTYISADFNTVVLNGATIERAADGHFVISTSGIVITKPGQANDSAAIAQSRRSATRCQPDILRRDGYTQASPRARTSRFLWHRKIQAFFNGKRRWPSRPTKAHASRPGKNWTKSMMPGKRVR